MVFTVIHKPHQKVLVLNLILMLRALFCFLVVSHECFINHHSPVKLFLCNNQR